MAKMFPAEKLRWIKKFTGHFQLKRNEQKIFVSLFVLAAAAQREKVGSSGVFRTSAQPKKDLSCQYF